MKALFFISFVFVGCGIDSAFTSPKAFVIWAAAFAVMALSGISIIKE